MFCFGPLRPTSTSARRRISAVNSACSRGSRRTPLTLSIALDSAGSPASDSYRWIARSRRASGKARLVDGTRSRAATAPVTSWRAARIRAMPKAAAATLTGQCKRQLGRKLTGDLPVDRVEGRLGSGEVPTLQTCQSAHPYGPPLPRVVPQHRIDELVHQFRLAKLKRGMAAGQEHLGC